MRASNAIYDVDEGRPVTQRRVLTRDDERRARDITPHVQCRTEAARHRRLACSEIARHDDDVPRAQHTRERRTERGRRVGGDGGGARDPGADVVRRVGHLGEGDDVAGAQTEQRRQPGDELLRTDRRQDAVRVDAGCCQRLLSAGASDAEDVREADLDALLARQVDTDETCHVFS